MCAAVRWTRGATPGGAPRMGPHPPVGCARLGCHWCGKRSTGSGFSWESKPVRKSQCKGRGPHSSRWAHTVGHALSARSGIPGARGLGQRRVQGSDQVRPVVGSDAYPTVPRDVGTREAPEAEGPRTKMREPNHDWEPKGGLSWPAGPGSAAPNPVLHPVPFNCPGLGIYPVPCVAVVGGSFALPRM